MAKFAWHGRERLGLLRVKDDALALHAMRWPDEIRSPETLVPAPVEVDDSEIEGAIALMEAMGQDDISGYTDHYREALEEVIAAKAAGKQPSPAGKPAQPAGEVVDLMAALNASVQAAKESRGEAAEGGEHATVHDMPKKRRREEDSSCRQEDRGEEAGAGKEDGGPAPETGLAKPRRRTAKVRTDRKICDDSTERTVVRCAEGHVFSTCPEHLLHRRLHGEGRRAARR